jgi:hypothetical protein
MPAQEVAVVVEDQDQLKDQDERRDKLITEPPALDAKDIQEDVVELNLADYSASDAAQKAAE